MNKRIEWIDVLKGIGMILVVIGHSQLPAKIQLWIWSFHMPLFFFLSGYLFDKNRYGSFQDFFKSKLRTLIVPYFFFTIINLVLVYLFDFDGFESVADVLFFGWRGLALWFIPVLFFTELVFYWIFTRAIFIMVILFAIFGYGASIYNIHFPYKLEVTFSAAVFFGIGFLMRSNLQLLLNSLALWLKLTIFSIALICNILFCFKNHVKFDMCFNIIGNPVFAFLSASTGIISGICLSSFTTAVPLLSRLKFVLSYIGKNTLIVLGLHQILKLVINNFISEILGLNKHLFISLARHLLFYLILFVVIQIFNKFFYKILGRKQPISY